MKKRMLSLLLALCMVLSCVPMSALAAEGDACTGTVDCTGTYDANGLCNVCGLAKPCAHTGGSATCKEQAVCENCGMPYGELAAHNYGTDADGMCDECGAECVHSYTNGLCICGVTEPEQEPVVLTISAWRWDDEAEIISADGTYATLPNAADWETLKTVLPQSITATVDGEEVTVPVTWECETFPAEGEAQGTYKLKAILPEGYTLGEDVAVLELEVELGVAEQYAVTASKPSVGDGSEANPYQITTAGELKWFQASASKSACAKLMNDITYNENVIVNGALTSDTSNLNKWTSIGTSNSPYTGTFDGDGNAVIGLYLDNVSSNYQGMFGCANGATIKNLTVKDSYINASTGVAYGLYVGAIVGGTKQKGSGVTITNCHNSGSIIRGGGSVGGIFGYSDRTAATITNCTNSGTITGLSTSGGSETGGIVGNLWYGSASVSGCSNSGTIISGCGNAGGIVGSMSSTTGTMSGCTNTGTVRYMEGTSDRAGALGGVAGQNTLAMTDCHNQGQVIGYRGMGGIAGYNSSNGSMTNCTNSGNVTAESPTEGHAGGVVYSNSATITNCSNSGAITGWRFLGGLACYNNGTISNCNNSGTVTASSNSTSTPATSGGLLAATKSKNGTIENSYNSGAVKGNNRVGGVAGKIEHACTFTNCYNVGEVTGTGTSSKDIGGVFGYYDASVTISNCYNEAAVSGYENVGGVAGWVNSALTNCHNSGNVNGTKYVGGVVGYVSNGSTFVVSKCYNTASVSGTSCVGGVAGYIRRAVENCYNTGAVSGTSSVGGVVGSQISANYVKYSYNIGDVTATSSFGGVVPSSAVTSCYYLDTCVTGGATVTGAAALTAEQMTDDTNWKTNYSGFDSTTPVWTKLNNVGTKGHLPRLDAIDEPYLTIEPAHEHSWTYEASDANGDSVNDTITATCTAAECTLTDRNGGTVSIAAPDSLVYTGSAIEAKVENTLVDTTTEVVVVYQKDGGTLSDKPSAPGTYTASITLGEAAVSVEYTIYTTITFDANGGAWEDGDVTKTVKGSEITTPAAPAKTGYSFDGWDREIPTTMPEENITIKAKWTVNQYTITFANTGDSTIAPITQDYGTTVTAPADPTWTGHSFQGWYDKNGQIYDFATPVTGDITLTAKWDLSTHRINVGTNVEDVTAKSDPQFVDWHKAATATISLYDEHTAKYEIVSIDKVSYWIDNEEIDITDRCTIDNEKLTVSIPENIIERDTHVNVTVKVKSFGVTFDYSDGVTETKREAVAYGETVGVPADPTWTGYSFQGWYDENGQRYDFTTPVTGDITLTAKWKAEIPAADFTATGYDCGTLTNVAAGMQYSLDQGDTWNDITSDTVELTGLEPLSAYYDGESRIWVKMPGNGTTTVDSEIQKINVYRESAPSNVTSSDYNMITGVTSSMEYRKAGAEQWTRVPEGAMSLSGLEAGVYEVRTAAVGKYLASGFIEVTVEDIPVYTITYETYGGTINGDYATEYTYGEGATLPTDVTRPMYHFRGWSDSDKAFNKVTEIPADASGDKTFYAWWETATYTVTFHANNGTDEEAQVVSGIVGTYNLPGCSFTAPEGNFFNGWATEDGKVIDSLYVDEDTDLYATWKPATYTITFDTDGGTEIAPITQDYGTAVTAPADPTREGYTFAGWDKEIPATMPAGDVTITATWTVNAYTITFDTDGGSEIEPITQAYGTAVTAPADPTKEGYTFAGWDKEISATMPAENVTITATWTVNAYTITFDTDGGTEIAPITQDYGTAVTAPADPAKEGHTFAGWDKEIPATMPAGDVTIKANWTVNSYTVTFAVNGEDYKEVEFAYGEKVVAPAYEIPAGHTFSGWTVPETMPAENITLDATLTINQYTITWKDDQDNTLYTEDLYYGTKPAFDAEQSDKELSKACHILSWSPEIVEVTENATYTAVWTLDHSGETEVRDAREATCTEDGYTGDTYCLGCGEKLKDGEAITAPGHSHGTEWESDEKQHWHECGCGDKADIADHTGGEATCKEPAQCEICGEAYGETDPENHTGETEIRDAKEATDTEDGYTGDTYCLDCGALLQKGEVIPATKPSVPSTPVKPLWKTWLEKWHEKWHDGCDKVECDHEYTDEIVEPTCCQKGYTVHTCDKCGFKYCDTYTEALGHAWDEGEVTKEASCTGNGEKTYTCEVCGETRTEVICATGHDYEDGTCTHCGEAEKPCKPCKPIIWPFFWRWLWKAK